MIKTTKKIAQKEKSNTNLTSNSQKISKQKSKNPNDKKVSLSKPKLNPIKTSKNFTESKFHTKKNHNSISSKDEVNTKVQTKTKNNKNKPTIVYNNTCGNSNSNNNKLFSSNLFLTNDTDIPIPDEEKKNLGKKLGKNLNNNKDEILNLPELENMFKKNTFKKTIIIDNEGNNNLHLNIKKGENDYKNLLNNNNSNSLFLSSSINANTETNSLFTNASKMEVSNLNNNNYIINENENEIKNNIMNDTIKNDEKNDEQKRIEEYTKIFNLLNTNIEQFKKMFNNNEANKETKNETNNNKLFNSKVKNIKNKKNQNQQKQNKKTTIQKKKTSTQNQQKKLECISVKKNLKKNINEKSLNDDTPKNLKKNLSEKNFSSSSKRIKVNQNIFTVEVRNDIEKDLNSDTKMLRHESNNAISSFLESSIQDDFYQSLMKGEFENENDEDKIIKDDIISVNIDEKGKDENIQDVQNSRIFRGKKENKKILINDNKNKTDDKEKNDDKNNCFIF